MLTIVAIGKAGLRGWGQRPRKRAVCMGDGRGKTILSLQGRQRRGGHLQEMVPTSK